MKSLTLLLIPLLFFSSCATKPADKSTSTWQTSETIINLWCISSFPQADCVKIFRDKSGLFYKNYCNENIVRMDWLDPNSVKFINHDDSTCSIYSQDKDNVYFWDEFKKLDWVNSKNFKLIDCTDGFSGQFSCYTTDESSIFLNNQKLIWIDTWTFQILWNIPYIRDKNGIYLISPNYWFEKLEQFDPNTFKYLWWDTTSGNVYLRDRNGVYWTNSWITRKIDWTNLESFIYLWGEWFGGDQFGKDKYHVYLNGEIIPWADGTSFELLKDSTVYWKDTNAIYFLSWKVIEADKDSFEYIDNGVHFDAKDKNHHYLWGKPVQ